MLQINSIIKQTIKQTSSKSIDFRNIAQLRVAQLNGDADIKLLFSTSDLKNVDLFREFNLSTITPSGPKETIGVKPSQLGLVGSVTTRPGVIRNIPIKDALASAVEQCKGDKIVVVGGKPTASAIRDYFGEVLAPCMLMGRPNRVINGIKTLQPLDDDPLATMAPAAALVTGIKFPDNSEKLVDSYVYYAGKKIDYTGTVGSGKHYTGKSVKGGLTVEDQTE